MTDLEATIDKYPDTSSKRWVLTPGEWVLLAVAALAFLHHVDHVLRADNSGWPFTPDVTPFTISLLVYPILLLDFLLLRRRPWVRVGLVAVLFAALQVDRSSSGHRRRAAGHGRQPRPPGNPSSQPGRRRAGPHDRRQRQLDPRCSPGSAR